jgi:hypothetical protein
MPRGGARRNAAASLPFNRKLALQQWLVGPFGVLLVATRAGGHLAGDVAALLLVAVVLAFLTPRGVGADARRSA